MNSLTTQLLNKSKTDKGFNQLNRDLQELRSRQEDNYHEYYYSGHYRDTELSWKEEGDGIEEDEEGHDTGTDNNAVGTIISLPSS